MHVLFIKKKRRYELTHHCVSFDGPNMYILFSFFFLKEVKKEVKEAKDFVKSEPKEEVSHATRREKSAGNVANLVQRMSTIGIPTGGFQPHPPPTAKSKTQSTSATELAVAALWTQVQVVLNF